MKQMFSFLLLKLKWILCLFSLCIDIVFIRRKMNSMLYPTKEYRRRMHTHFRVLLHITITQKRDVVVRRVRFALSVKSSGVKYVSGVLFFTRSVSLEGNRRIEKWKEIRQGEKRKHSKWFERGWSFHNSSESSSLLLRCLPLYAVAYIHHFHNSAQSYYYCGPVDGRRIRCLSH